MNDHPAVLFFYIRIKHLNIIPYTPTWDKTNKETDDSNTN